MSVFSLTLVMTIALIEIVISKMSLISYFLPIYIRQCPASLEMINLFVYTLHLNMTLDLTMFSRLKSWWL